MKRAQDFTPTLRSLDAAEPRIDPGTDPRAHSDLQVILADAPASRCVPTAGSVSASTRAGRPRTGNRPARRVALLTMMAAAITAAVVALPPLIGSDPALASWTPSPVGMSHQERGAAATDCRQNLAEAPMPGLVDELNDAEPVIAGRRGAWTTVVLAGPAGFTAMCISDETDHLFGTAMIGSAGTPADYSPPAPRELRTTDLGTGSMHGHDISLAAGYVGSDVVGVRYRSRAHGQVTATVSRGHFALWLPGDEFGNASRRGVHVEVTYRDGTTDTRLLTL